MAGIIAKIPNGLFKVCNDYLEMLLSSVEIESESQYITLKMKKNMELIIAMYIERYYSIPCVNSLYKGLETFTVRDILSRYNLMYSEPLDIILPSLNVLPCGVTFSVKVIDTRHFALIALRGS